MVLFATERGALWNDVIRASMGAREGGGVQAVRKLWWGCVEGI